MILRSQLSCAFCCLGTGVTDLFADVLCLCCYVLQEAWRLTDTPLEDSCQMPKNDTHTPENGRPSAAHNQSISTVNIYMKYWYIYLEVAPR
jgi:hypothetical protein